MVIAFLILFNELETAVTFTRDHFNQVVFAVMLFVQIHIYPVYFMALMIYFDLPS